MIQSILSNVAIILLMHLTMTMILNLQKKIRPGVITAMKIMLISGSVICMFYLPIRLGDFWVDMRFIPLIFLAYIQGPKVALPSLFIASLYRFFMGGEGMVPGIIFGMVGPTLLALAFHWRSHLKGNYLEKIGIVIGAWLICDVPIIFIIPDGLEVFKSIAFVRAFSFVATSIVLYLFIMMEQQRASLNKKLQKLAGEDPLTKLLNKRKFFEVVEEKVCSLEPKHFLAMVDLDHFKRLNDTYGHIVGDKILIHISNILRRYESQTIKVGRYGGEEFIIYLGNTTYEDAANIAERIREEIKATPFLFKDGKSIQVTVSIGLAELTDGSGMLHSVHQADKCLYKAKQRGRDRIVTMFYYCHSPIPAKEWSTVKFN